jgi:hypothetical protein
MLSTLNSVQGVESLDALNPLPRLLRRVICVPTLWVQLFDVARHAEFLTTPDSQHISTVPSPTQHIQLFVAEPPLRLRMPVLRPTIPSPEAAHSQDLL